MSYQIIEQSKWPRAEHFKFYASADQPWFNVCTNIEASALYNYCKLNKLSFFHAYLFCTQKALNINDAFKLRLVGDEIRQYEKIRISTTVLGENDLMHFCDFDYQPTFEHFSEQARQKEQEVKSQPFMAEHFYGNDIRQDVIHMSVLPWISFTGFTNAKHSNVGNSVPKIVFGKCFEENGQKLMPLSIEVHHGIMDGLHVGKFISSLESFFNSPDATLG